MDTCEFQSSCNLYNDLKARNSAVLKYIKDEYCDSGYSECARFIVSKFHGTGCITRDLFPLDAEEACKILDELN